MDCSLPGSSVHGIFQARILKWAISSYRGPSRAPLLHPGIEPTSPALQVLDFLLSPHMVEGTRGSWGVSFIRTLIPPRGLHLLIPSNWSVLVAQSCLTLCNPVDYSHIEDRFLCPWMSQSDMAFSAGRSDGFWRKQHVFATQGTSRRWPGNQGLQARKPHMWAEVLPYWWVCLHPFTRLSFNFYPACSALARPGSVLVCCWTLLEKFASSGSNTNYSNPSWTLGHSALLSLIISCLPHSSQCILQAFFFCLLLLRVTWPQAIMWPPLRLFWPRRFAFSTLISLKQSQKKISSFFLINHLSCLAWVDCSSG